MSPSVVRSLVSQSIHSPAIVLLVTVFVGLFGGATFAYPSIHAAAATSGQIGSAGLLALLARPAAAVVAVTALLYGYGQLPPAVGSLLFDPDEPSSPTVTLIWTTITRIGVLWGTLLVGWTSAGIGLVSRYPRYSITALAGFAVLAALLGAVFVAVGLAIRVGVPPLLGGPMVLALIAFVLLGVPAEGDSSLAQLLPSATFTTAAESLTTTTVAGDPSPIGTPWVGSLVLIGWVMLAIGVGRGFVRIRA